LLSFVVGCNNGGLANESGANPTPTPEVSPTPTPGPQPNATPVAIVDAIPATFSPLDTVSLGGYTSYDPDGIILVWQWEILTRPQGSTSMPQAVSANNAFADFLLDLAGPYTLRLTVFDNEGGTASSEIVAFTAVPDQYFHAELDWDLGGNSDVDLHVMDVTAGGVFQSAPYDCFYSNKTPEWGAAGLGDNPRLDLDDTTGFGPENVNIDFPANGSKFRVLAHYFADAGMGPTTVRIRLYLNGVIVLDETEVLEATDKAWSLVEVDWPSGNLTIIDQLFDA
jgi:hypothetical protein